MDNLTLYDAVKHYLIYQQACRVPKNQYRRVQGVLSDVLAFYGRNSRLSAFDSSLVLEYVKDNDPFDCDPVHQERGEIFCELIDWLMQNKLIPAWSSKVESHTLVD